jgi:hypothetical protein
MTDDGGGEEGRGKRQRRAYASVVVVVVVVVVRSWGVREAMMMIRVSGRGLGGEQRRQRYGDAR